jgi:protein O-mannosyl-transferase
MSKKNKKPEQPIVSDNKPIQTVRQNTPTVSPTSSPTFWQNIKLQAGLIFALSFLLYANTLTHDFCQDDAIVITDNMFTTEGVSGISGILKYDTFYGFFKEEGKANLVAGGRYRPFTLIMFAIEYQIFGKNPFMGHLFNVLWFGVTCVLVYFLLLKLLKYKQNGGNTEGVHSAEMLAFATAILFAAHPIHTEVVANIKGRDEIITLLGSLAAVWFSLKAFEKGGVVNQILAGILFFIALLAKENAITFVALVPLVYWFFIKTDWETAFKQVIPFVGSTVLFMLLRWQALGYFFNGNQSEQSGQNELMNNPYLKLVGNQYIPFELGEKLATIVFTLGKYLQLLIFPHPLTHDYYPRHIGIMNFSDIGVILSVLLYAGLIFLMVKNWKSRSLISFGIAFFLLTLSIVSNMVFPVGTNMAERFMFMPSVGFCLVTAYFLLELSLRAERGRRGVNFKTKMGILGVITLLFSLKTVTRNVDWKDDYTLFTHDVHISENSAKVQCSAGGKMIDKAKELTDKTQKEAMMNEAIGHLRKSTEIHPTFKSPYLLLGNAYIYLENYEKAVPEYLTALKLDPNFKDAKSNIALAYREIGRNAGQVKKDLEGSIENLNRALQYNPQDAETLSYLGTAYGMKDQFQNSIDVLERALAVRFNRQDAINLIVSYQKIGNIAKANEWDKKVQGITNKQ